ncbi:MAG TPA: M3 family metallopeptidase, partial [Gemmatimonadota bacterium]|nr:M3 family metallopeptidase [Gemmatimonadota bacterium]
MLRVPVSTALLVLLGLTAGSRVAAAQSLEDPGPVWAGITDTTSFRHRLERHVAAAEDALAELRAVRGPRTVANTVVPYKNAEFHLNAAAWLAGLGLNAHPDADFRAYAQQWQRRIAARSAALDADRGLYDALAAVDLSHADAGIRYIVERDLDAYRRNGIDRSDAVRERVAALRAQITAVGTRFERNIFTDRDTLRFDPDSLEGMPEDWLAAYPPDADGLVTLEITPANALPLRTFAESGSTREAAFRARLMAGYPANVPVLDSLRLLRHELATLLGYPSWAAYAAAPMMAGSPERIRQFLDEADEASDEATRREIAALLARRRVEQPWAEGIGFPSLMYWQNKVRQEDYAFDAQAMREYLPYDRVRDGVLASFERMFELEFRPAPETPVWSPAVEPYEVWEDGALVGRFYLDMHPRDGKFGHNAQFDLRLGGGTLPEAALICNFPGGTEGDPGLLQPVNMVTFFHEFGHLVHALLAGQSAIMGEVEWDFIEAPSQLVEEWEHDPAVLRSFARHY